ncbi:tape measure protein [bacterium]|nr:tape measure protein [bacterium]
MAGRFTVESIFKAVDRVTAPVSRMQQRVGKFTRSMERGLRSADRALDKVVGGMKAVGSAAIKLGAIGLGAVTAAATLLIREFSKVENAEAAFTPLLGGAEKARLAVAALNRTAASTPFQFEDLASVTSQLLPVMNGNIEDTIRTIRLLGDTAGGNAQKLDSITRGFTKAMLKGKVDMESLNMIAEAGVPIFTELADSMGVKVNSAFFKMISAGKVTTGQLTKAFEKMTGSGGVFFNGMEIASKTTTGLFSTLKDNISLTAAELGSVLAPTVKELIVGATKAAAKVREWVTNNRELINARFMAAVEKIKEAFFATVEAIRKLNAQHSLLARLREVIVGISDGFAFFRKHGGTILKVVAAVVALSLAVKVATLAMAAFNLLAAANPIGLVVVALAAAAALVIANWTPIKAFFKDLWVGVVATFDAAVARIMAIVDKVKAVAATIADTAGAVGDFVFGDDADRAQVDRRGRPTRPQVVSPQDRTAKMVEERRTTSTAEVTIRDETNRASVTRGRMGRGVTLQPSGAF